MANAPLAPSAPSTAWEPCFQLRSHDLPTAGSTAVSCSFDPKRGPRRPARRRPPGRRAPGARASPAVIGIGEKLFCAVMRVVAGEQVVHGVPEVGDDARRQHGDEVTSARPIISADGGRGGSLRVAARVVARQVADGAGDPGRRPAEPRGQARHDPRREQRDADEHQDRPERPSDRAPRRCRWPRTGRGSARRSRAPRSRRRRVRYAANRPSGSVAPSRTAAIGSTRVARSAGRRLASTVTMTPTRRPTMIVRGLTTCRCWAASRRPR